MCLTCLQSYSQMNQILFCSVSYDFLRLYLTENKKQGSILKNSNIYDKSTPMSGDYGTNEHIQSLNCKMAIKPTGRRYHKYEK